VSRLIEDSGEKEGAFFEGQEQRGGHLHAAVGPEVEPGPAVGLLEDVGGGLEDVLQDLPDVRLLVVEHAPGRLKPVLDPAGHGPHDGHGRLQISSVESLGPGDVGQRADQNVLGVLLPNLSLQIGHGHGLAVGHVRLGPVPLRVNVLAHLWQANSRRVHAVPLGQAGGADGAGLNGNLANGCPIPLELPGSDRRT